MKFLNCLILSLSLFFILFLSLPVSGASCVSENWHNSICLQVYYSNAYLEDLSSIDIDYDYAYYDPYEEKVEEESKTSESQIERANKEARIIRNTTIIGGIMGTLPALVFGGLFVYSGDAQFYGVIFGTVGGGVVGSLSGNAFARAMLPSKQKNPALGFVIGVPLGVLAGALTGATAGGLILLGSSENDSEDLIGGPGFGMLGGAIIGGILGGITGGVAGAAIHGSSNVSETRSIDLGNCDMNLVAPTIYIHSDPFGEINVAYGVELFKVNF